MAGVAPTFRVPHHLQGELHAPPTLRTVALASVLALGLAACGGSADSDSDPAPAAAPAAEPDTLDPCELLTTEELESLNGADLEQTGPATEESRGRRCEWSAADGSIVAISTWHGSAFFADVPEADHLPGLGDANYAEPTINTVTFLQGDEVFLVFGGESEATARAISSSL